MEIRSLRSVGRKAKKLVSDEYLVDGKYSIKDLVNIRQLRRSFEEFSNVTGFTTGFVSYPDQEILIATGWREACTQYHRRCPASAEACKESNIYLTSCLKNQKDLSIKRCSNGLVDGATPVIIRGKHLASVSTGQVLFEPPDPAFFKRQAKKFGYDEKSYLATIRKLPVVTEKQLKRVLRYLSSLAVFIGEEGLNALRVKDTAELLREENARRRESEQALQKSERKYRILFEGCRDAIIIRDRTGRFLDCNEAALRLFKFRSKDELTSTHPHELSPGRQEDGTDSATAAAEHIKKARLEGDCLFGWLCKKRDGTVFPTEVLLTRLEMDGATVLQSVIRDISERRVAETSLRQSEDRYRTLIEQAPDGLFVIETQLGRYSFVDVNSAACRMFGYSREEALGLSIVDVVTREEMPRIESEVARLQSGETAFTEWRLRCKDGSVIPCEVRARQIPGGRIQGFVRDITERKRAEERILQLNRVQAILCGVDRAIVHFPERQNLLDEICRVAVEIGGFKLAWIGMVSPDESVHPVAKAGATGYLDGIRVVARDDEPEGRGPTGTAIREKRPVEIGDIGRDMRMAPWRERARRFGLHYHAVFPIWISGKLTGTFQVYAPHTGLIDKGELSLLTQVSEDISFALTAIDDNTKRKVAEGALLHSERELADFFRTSPLGLLWVRPDGHVLRVNEAELELLGYASREVMGRPISRFHADPDAAADLLDRLARGETVENYHVRIRRKDRSIIHVLIDANGLWENDQLIHSRWFVRDISRRVELEREILRIIEVEQRRLGHDLHDDLCQQLAGISFLSETLAKHLGDGFPAGAAQAREIAHLVQSAMTRTREMAAGLSPVPLEAEGLMEALKDLAARTKKIFHIDCNFQCGKPVFVPDHSVGMHLYRIAQEAVSNAIKHGKARCVDIGLTANGNDVVLAVRDNGLGIPVKARNHKGMGLRIMQYRAGVIGGSLLVQRDPNGGTTVVCTVSNGLLPPKERLVE
jgi:PAS domain S-box-containing protein